MEWVAWMIAAGVLAVGEMFTLSFFMGPLAVAAVLAAVAGLAGLGLVLQAVVFVIAAVASLGVLRPIAKRHLKTPGQLRTGTARLVGAQAEVLEQVNARGGQVKLAGEVWSARAWDDDETLEPGERVHVMDIEGATALVTSA